MHRKDKAIALTVDDSGILILILILGNVCKIGRNINNDYYALVSKVSLHPKNKR